MKPIVAWIGPNRRRASPVENGGRLFCAAFRPGQEVWPFGRRPPGRDGNDGPRGRVGRLGLHIVRLEPIEASFPLVTPWKT